MGVVLVMSNNKWDSKHYVLSGFGDSDCPAACWDCELVKVFTDKKLAVKFSEKHYDNLIDEIMSTVNSHWYKSVFVVVVDRGALRKFRFNDTLKRFDKLGA
jgi:hypothetical protein